MADRRGKRSSSKLKVFAGRYAYDKPLGRGAGGSVYLANDLLSGWRQVALKVLTAEACKTVQGKMLRREFEILSKLEHPYLVNVYDYGRLPDGGVFLAEEYIEGFSLQDARALLEPRALIDVTLQILHGLAYLHGMGTIHRDIKPANVMLLWPEDAETRPMVKLVDFGLSSMDPKRDTLRGGTRSYMAPEIIRGEKGEPRSDLFSLGVTLYYALCGVLPFGPRSKDDPPPTDEPFRPPEPHRLNPQVPLSLSRFTMVLLRQVAELEFADAGEALQSFGRDTEGALTQQTFYGGQMANSLDLAASPVLRGFFERGIVGSQADVREALVQRFSERRGRAGRIDLVRGQAGVGKSRLLREVEADAKLAGRAVIALRCRPDDGPYELIQVLLQRLLSRLESRDGGAVQAEYERLVLVLHRLGHILRSSGSEEALGEERWVGEVLSALVEEVGEESLLVTVEELEHVDAASARFLELWYGQSRWSRPDLVATAREGVEGGWLRPEQMGARVFEAQGLDVDDVVVFFEQRLGLEGVDHGWCGEVARLALGRPGYLEELCRHLVDQGLLRRVQARRWSLEPGALTQVLLPAGVTESIRRRLQPVGGTAREALEVLAIAGRRLEWSALRQLVASGPERQASVDQAIETLIWRHLVKMDLTMDGRQVELIHPAVGEVVLGLISGEWRRSLHRRVGLFLRERWRDGGEVSLEEVIEHLLAAGMPGRAAQVETLLLERELMSTERGLRQRRGKPPIWVEGEAPEVALQRIVRARVALARFSALSCREHIEAAGQLAERTALDWLMFRTTVAGARVAFSVGDGPWAAMWIERAHDVLPTLARQPPMLELDARLAIMRGDLQRAGAALQEAQDRSQHFGDLGGLVRALVLRAHVAQVSGASSEALNLVQQALAQPHQVDPLDQAFASLVHGMLLRRLKASERASVVLQHALEKMVNRDVPDLWIGALVELSASLREMGQYDEARRQVRAARHFAERLGHPALRLEAALGAAELAVEEMGGGGPRPGVEPGLDLETPALLIEQMKGVPELALACVEGDLRLGRLLEALGQQHEGASRVQQALEAARAMGALGLV